MNNIFFSIFSFFFLQSSRTQWQIIFIIAAAVFFFGNLVYIWWGTAVTQPWDAEDYLIAKDTESSNSNRDSEVTAEIDTKSIETSRPSEENQTK